MVPRPLFVTHCLLGALLGACALLAPALAVAQSTESRAGLLAEPIGYTNVADAFEEGDPIDVQVSLGFEHRESASSIEREIVDYWSIDGRSNRNFIQVAEHESALNELALQLDVGVYHDVMISVRLPVVLGEDQELRPLPGAACSPDNSSEGCRGLLEPSAAGAPTPLFDLAQPLSSAHRSGSPGIELGAAWSVTNQYRASHLPTWVLRATAMIETGRVRAACTGGNCEPGIARGTNRLTLESRWSYRLRYFEPLFGVAQTFQWIARGDGLFRPGATTAGMVDADPPWTTALTLGTAFIPWEDRGRFQRVELDLTGKAAFVGAGRDYSPLFDALGSSSNEHLQTPDDGAPSLSAPFVGLTQVDGHAQLGLELAAVVRAARYVSFALAGGLSHLTAHLLTGAQACDASSSAGGTRRGGCPEGIVNPLYRAVIDTPGQRFRMVSEVSWHLSTSAMGRF
jgi:hypothetical protein